MTDNFGMDAFLAQWLNDIQDGQRADGSISMIDPIRDGCCYGYAPEWTAAYPLVSWDIYVRYGDRDVLSRITTHSPSTCNGRSAASRTAFRRPAVRRLEFAGLRYGTLKIDD